MLKEQPSHKPQSVNEDAREMQTGRYESVGKATDEDKDFADMLNSLVAEKQAGQQG